MYVLLWTISKIFYWRCKSNVHASIKHDHCFSYLLLCKNYPKLDIKLASNCNDNFAHIPASWEGSAGRSCVCYTWVTWDGLKLRVTWCPGLESSECFLLHMSGIWCWLSPWMWPLFMVAWLPHSIVAGFQEQPFQDIGSGSCQFLKFWPRTWHSIISTIFCFDLSQTVNELRFKGKRSRLYFLIGWVSKNLGCIFKTSLFHLCKYKCICI
jgi:hypothetical protein